MPRHQRPAASKHDAERKERRLVFMKTKLCKFHIMGTCMKGDGCMFAHSASDMNASPDLSFTKLCPQLINTGECTDPQCKFAHNKDQLRAPEFASQTQPAASLAAAPQSADDQAVPAPIKGAQTAPMACMQIPGCNLNSCTVELTQAHMQRALALFRMGNMCTAAGNEAQASEFYRRANLHVAQFQFLLQAPETAQPAPFFDGARPATNCDPCQQSLPVLLGEPTQTAPWRPKMPAVDEQIGGPTDSYPPKNTIHALKGGAQQQAKALQQQEHSLNLVPESAVGVLTSDSASSTIVATGSEECTLANPISENHKWNESSSVGSSYADFEKIHPPLDTSGISVKNTFIESRDGLTMWETDMRLRKVRSCAIPLCLLGMERADSL